MSVRPYVLGRPTSADGQGPSGGCRGMRSSAAGGALGDLLEEPLVAVGVLEGGEGAVTGPLGVESGHPVGVTGVVEGAGLVAERAGDLDTAGGQFLLGLDDV